MKQFIKAVLSRLLPPREAATNRPPPDARRIDEVKHLLQEQTRLHLGCGGNLLSGWANLDLSGAPPVIEWDLTYPIPGASHSFDLIYSEHFIEHIRLDQAKTLLRECHRMLKPGGRIRLSTPNLEKLVDEYRNGRVTEWADMQWAPPTACQMLNEGMRLWGHQFVYDFTELRETLTECGFVGIERLAWRQSRHPPLQNLESRPFHDELIVEATK